MTELFKAKVRKVGTSIGVLIPKGITKQEKIKIGEEIQLIILKQRRLAEVWKLIGTAKGTKPFERDRIDRMERY
ncbi:hypothetical protein HYX00_01605 [Candidatus Woesearchaeota archaeon]|nr:hypothetical protein [Candidatus Woesearchaeota archaeon]